MSFRSDGLSRFAKLLYALTLFLVIGVVFAAARAPRVLSDDGMLGIGASVSSPLSAMLQDRGETVFLFVSDVCAVCRDRVASYITHVSDRPDWVLVVAENVEAPLFATAIEDEPRLHSRVLRFPTDSFTAQTGVRSVPSFARVNASGSVLAEGMSNLGWFRAAASPTRWISAWRHVLGF